jgi:hypothetical protein
MKLFLFFLLSLLMGCASAPEGDPYCVAYSRGKVVNMGGYVYFNDDVCSHWRMTPVRRNAAP